METATFAGGCFWCTEAIYKRIKGVTKIEPGYTGGRKENPTYEEVCSGSTGHAEAIQIEFDPKIISFEKLTEVFFALHDPTTPNQQGADFGTQYRSAIFYHNSKQKEIAQSYVQKLEKSGKYKQSLRSSTSSVGLKNKIITEVVPIGVFYKAENYHQNYFDNNRSAPYCQVVIDPKINKLYENFKELTNS